MTGLPPGIPRLMARIQQPRNIMGRPDVRIRHEARIIVQRRHTQDHVRLALPLRCQMGAT
jgi:hypothetical protein